MRVNNLPKVVILGKLGYKTDVVTPNHKLTSISAVDKFSCFLT